MGLSWVRHRLDAIDKKAGLITICLNGGSLQGGSLQIPRKTKRRRTRRQ